MPGAKSVTWTESNRAKLLDAFVALESIKVSDATCGQMAAYIGNGCTVRAVRRYLTSTGKAKCPEVLAAASNLLSEPSDTQDATPVDNKKELASRVSGGGVSKGQQPRAKRGRPRKNAVNIKKEEVGGGMPRTPPMSGEEFFDAESNLSVTPRALRVSSREKKGIKNCKLPIGFGSDEEDAAEFAEDSEASDTEFDVKQHLASGGDSGELGDL